MTTLLPPQTVTLPPRSDSLTLGSLMRNYATPLAGSLMLIVGVSGVLMFFHLASGNVKELHEWLGLGLLAAMALHLLRNGRAFRNLLAAPRTQVMAGASCLAVALFLALAPVENANSPVRAVMTAAEKAPLSRLAPVLGVEPELLINRLAEAGIPARADQSIEDIARVSHGNARELMGMLATASAPVKAPRHTP